MLLRGNGSRNRLCVTFGGAGTRLGIAPARRDALSTPDPRPLVERAYDRDAKDLSASPHLANPRTRFGQRLVGPNMSGWPDNQKKARLS